MALRLQRATRTPEEAAEIYTVSLLAIDVDNPAERGYLAMLAARLNLEYTEVRSPIDRDWLLGRFAAGTAAHAQSAVRAARKAFPGWAATPWRDLVGLLLRAAQIIEERVYDIGAAVVNQLNGQSLTDVTGSQGIAFNQARGQNMYAFGWSAASTTASARATAPLPPSIQ